jgi:hypothetical protein
MAGILDQSAQAGVPPEGPVEEVTPQQEGAGEGVVQGQDGPGELAAEEPTPEEQEEFTGYETAAKKIIHNDKKVFNKVAKMIEQGSEDPVKTLARVALMIFAILDKGVKGGVPEDLILRVAEVTLDHIIALAEGLELMQIDDNMANDAMLEMIKQAGEMYGFDTTDMEQSVNANPSVSSRREGGAPEQQAEQVPQQGEVPPAAQQQAAVPPAAQQQVAPAGGV